MPLRVTRYLMAELCTTRMHGSARAELMSGPEARPYPPRAVSDEVRLMGRARGALRHALGTQSLANRCAMFPV